MSWHDDMTEEEFEALLEEVTCEVDRQMRLEGRSALTDDQILEWWRWRGEWSDDSTDWGTPAQAREERRIIMARHKGLPRWHPIRRRRHKPTRRQRAHPYLQPLPSPVSPDQEKAPTT